MEETRTDHIRLTETIDAWLQRIGFDLEADVAQAAVDLADLLRAAGQVRAALADLLRAPLATRDDCDEALRLAAEIEVQLFTEMKGHLDSLQDQWPKVLSRLDQFTSNE